jgi:hypothetical protein
LIGRNKGTARNAANFQRAHQGGNRGSPSEKMRFSAEKYRLIPAA